MQFDTKWTSNLLVLNWSHYIFDELYCLDIYLTKSS